MEESFYRLKKRPLQRRGTPVIYPDREGFSLECQSATIPERLHGETVEPLSNSVTQHKTSLSAVREQSCLNTHTHTHYAALHLEDAFAHYPVNNYKRESRSINSWPGCLALFTSFAMLQSPPAVCYFHILTYTMTSWSSLSIRVHFLQWPSFFQNIQVQFRLFTILNIFPVHILYKK